MPILASEDVWEAPVNDAGYLATLLSSPLGLGYHDGRGDACLFRMVLGLCDGKW
jgi:hypothetical protein